MSPEKDDNILQCNKYVESHEIPYIIYADIDSLIEKKTRWMCKQPRIFFNNKLGEHRKQTYFKSRKKWMKKFCTCSREHTPNVINFEKKEMSPLTKNS